MNKKMTIYLSPSNGFGTTGLTVHHKNQTVRYVNIFDGDKVPIVEPDKLPMEYDTTDKSKAVVLLNYKKSDNPAIGESEGYSTVRGSDTLTLDVFKQEIDRIPAEDDNVEALTSLEIVAQGLQQYHFKDYNVSNGRKYRYVIYERS